MKLIRTALPTLAGEVSALAGEFRLFAHVLAGSAGVEELPTSVLATAYEVLAVAPTSDRMAQVIAGSEERRHGLVDASLYLVHCGFRPEAEDIDAAIRVWACTIGRASQMYGAMRVTAQSDERTAPLAAQQAAALNDFIGRFGLDLAILTAAAARPEKLREITIAQVAKHVEAGKLRRSASRPVRRPRGVQLEIGS
mgnify:CR=1 FL=1